MPITVTPRGSVAGYKVYAALLNQSGTDAPVATVLQNTLGGEVVWARDDTGVYSGTLAGVFPANKVPATISWLISSDDGSSGTAAFKLFRNTDDQVTLRTGSDFNDIGGSASDDLLLYTFIEIRVFP